MKALSYFLSITRNTCNFMEKCLCFDSSFPLEFYFLEFVSLPKVPVVLLSPPPFLLYIYVYVCFDTVSAWFSTSATKKRMQNVANISILAMFVMYLLTALFGYLTFYGNFLSKLALIR